MKKILSAAVAAIMLSVSVSCGEEPKGGEMRDISTMELVRDMGIGINLGNTYESCGDWINGETPDNYEQAWGSPDVTKELIQGYADEGFGTLRVPVAWSNMMSDDNKISKEYAAEVRKAVDWALDSDMYVIINLHWDGGWLEKMPEDKENVMKKYSEIWEQVSKEFKDYGDHLIFESQNEELGWNSLWNRWGGTVGKDESYALVNEVNQTFVDIVRDSGGKNKKRHLLISGYNTDVELTCDPLFKMPDDPAGRCAVSVHYYTPSTFAILEKDADWGLADYTWGTDAEIAELEKNMDMMKSTYVDNGIPVIIGEYGCPVNNKDPESVRLYVSSVCRAAYERQMCPVLWDVTDAQYSRSEYKMKDEELKKMMMSVLDE
ncbi:MAG: glycoside hydrolase family 5 protein [Ruminococcus sp.]|nr:glycoside hydrolase family 5 protein [Ruminococcus sp.]